MNILVAEDDRVSAMKLRRALEKMGHTVGVVHDGAGAWDRVREGGVELLISDWMMPEMDGPELCRRVRAQPDALYTYVILLTSLSGRDDRFAGLEAGADDFLTKPLDTGELLARLNVARRILTMQEQLRGHAAQLVGLHAALERQNALLAERADTDGLTGLSNRRRFDEALDAALTAADQNGKPLSLVLLDVDHFKAYNDAFGHQAGDEVLRDFAETLRRFTQARAVVARYGGEEFALVLPATDTQGAWDIAERLRVEVAGHDWPFRLVTASFGIATADPPVPDAAHLIDQADRALYQSKTLGRDRVTHYLDLIPHDTTAAH